MSPGVCFFFYFSSQESVEDLLVPVDDVQEDHVVPEVMKLMTWSTQKSDK